MTPRPGAARRVLALSVDLMDRSRLQEAAPEGVTVELFRKAGDVWAAADAATGAVLVLLDLTRPGAIDEIPDAPPADVTVIGFGPHVDDDLLARGRAAGLHEVLPRSVFFRRVPEILGGPASI